MVQSLAQWDEKKSKGLIVFHYTYIFTQIILLLALKISRKPTQLNRNVSLELISTHCEV